METGWDGFQEIVAIADAGSFVRAASRLGTSTSHVSRVVARLEKRLDMQIFRRTTRQVIPTDRGSIFVDRCRAMINERDEMLLQLTGDGEPQGEVKITCSIALGERFVAPVVRQFAEAHTKLSVMLDLTNRVVDIVGEGYDLGIRTGRLTDDRLAKRKIASRVVETCASPTYLESAGIPGVIEDLVDHRCLIGTSSTWYFAIEGGLRTFQPVGRWRCNSGAVVADAALAGMGVCHLPAIYVADHLRSGRLVRVLQQCRVEPEAVWAVYPIRRQLLPKVRNLVNRLESVLQAFLGSDIDKGAQPFHAA